MSPVTSHPPARSQQKDPPASFAEHLEELRRRLGISLASLLVAVGICATQVERVIGWLKRPAEPLVSRLVYFNPTEPLTAYLEVAVLCGLILSMPVFLFELWGFIRSGLSARERSWGLTFIWGGSALFVSGVAFAYTVVLPLSLHVLFSFGRSLLVPVISLQQYLEFVTSILFWCGVLFELPAVVWLLAVVGVVTTEWLRQQRPYAVLILVMLAAVITPTTDAVSLVLMTLPLVALYEISILLTRSLPRRRT